MEGLSNKEKTEQFGNKITLIRYGEDDGIYIPELSSGETLLREKIILK